MRQFWKNIIFEEDFKENDFYSVEYDIICKIFEGRWKLINCYYISIIFDSLTVIHKEI